MFKRIDHIELLTAAPRRTIAFYVEVEHLGGALTVLGEKGVATAWGPVERPDYARAEIRDPDGNPIELQQWHRRQGSAERAAPPQ